MENALGPIAASYDELQGIPSLRKAQSSLGSKTSAQSLDSTFAQCAEILLLNMADLIVRAAHALERNGLERNNKEACVSRLQWAHDFARLLNAVCSLQGQNSTLHRDVVRFTLDDSIALEGFLDSVAELEDSVRTHVAHPAEVFGHTGPSVDLVILDLAILDELIVLGHEWLMLGDSVRISGAREVSARPVLPGVQEIHCAVFEPRLLGDTFFMQFRACHQVPELLIWTANEFYLTALEDVAAGRTLMACQKMLSGNELLDLATKGTYPLIANLAAEEYHKIRANLGMTSGSHSHAMHVVLLTAIHKEMADLYAGLAADRDEDRLLRQMCGQFLSLTQAWRNMHALLPKRNLGANRTRSLIGAPEAASAVELMRQRPLPEEPRESRLFSFFRDPTRLQMVLLSSLGEVTNARFQDVQRRSGVFSAASHSGKDGGDADLDGELADTTSRRPGAGCGEP